MFEEPNIDKLMVGQVKALRKALFDRLMFEPVTDPGFRRPLAKLTSQVRESEALMERFRSSVLFLQNLNALAEQARQTLEGPAYLTNASQWAVDLMSQAPESPTEALNEYSLPADQIEKRTERRRLRNELAVEAVRLSTEWMGHKVR